MRRKLLIVILITIGIASVLVLKLCHDLDQVGDAFSKKITFISRLPQSREFVFEESGGKGLSEIGKIGFCKDSLFSSRCLIVTNGESIYLKRGAIWCIVTSGEILNRGDSSIVLEVRKGFEVQRIMDSFPDAPRFW